MTKPYKKLYDEQREHPLWQKRKGEILTRDNHTCRSCGSEHVTLHAHHIVYIPGYNLWDYEDSALITLCEVCHNTEHLIGNVLREELLKLIVDKPLMIHMVAQLCVLIPDVPDFEDSLRRFLRKGVTQYHDQKRKSNG